MPARASAIFIIDDDSSQRPCVPCCAEKRRASFGVDLAQSGGDYTGLTVLQVACVASEPEDTMSKDNRIGGTCLRLHRNGSGCTYVGARRTFIE